MAMHLKIDAASLRPMTRLEHPRSIIRQFTPNWFAVTMGTGILALLLGQFPDIRVVHAAGETLWLINIALYTLFCLLYAARWIAHFDEAKRILEHPVMSMFFGCIPMGLATIVNGFVLFAAPRIGDTAIEIAFVLWYADVALALACGLVVPFFMFTRQSHSMEGMTAVWLLPIVACEVAAVSGATLLAHADGPAAEIGVMLASYVLWAFSVPLALGILVILLLRMALHRIPPASMAATSWLAVGPLATGALGLVLLSGHAAHVLEVNGLGAVAAAVSGASLLGGILLWGYGSWWLLMAGLITLRHLREGVPFNMGWWGYTFPLGVYALATLRLGETLGIHVITGFATALVCALGAIWIVVATRTVHGAWHGHLFVAPCLRTAS